MNNNTNLRKTITKGSYTLCKALILTIVFQFLPGGMTDSGYCNMPVSIHTAARPVLVVPINESGIAGAFQTQLQQLTSFYRFLQIEISWERLFKTTNSKDIEENKTLTKKTIPPTYPVNPPENDEGQLAHLHDHNEEDNLNLRHPALAKLAIILFFTILILFRLTPILFT